MQPGIAHAQLRYYISTGCQRLSRLEGLLCGQNHHPHIGESFRRGSTSTISPQLCSDTTSMAAGQDSLSRKLRVLCLHGYLQNSETFRAKIGSLRKGLKSRVEFYFVDAPHLVSGAELDVKATGGAKDQPRAWWTWQDTESGMRPSLAARYTGWQASLDILAAKFQELHPIDGILGFSQGATAAVLLLAHLLTVRSKHVPRFAILVAGFLPRDPQYAQQVQGACPNVPIIIVHGEADVLVPMNRSCDLQNALASNSDQVTRWSHPGAHMVPTCSGDFKKQLQAFLDGIP